VSPELIDVATASAKWQQPFDAALTDVFRVQADVAGQVAQALDVEIGARQREALAARPTQSLEAYDAYLKGKAARGLGPDPVTLRQAIGFQQRAVALDSGFQAAWAELSESSSLLWFNGAPSPALAEQARAAAEHAIALDPRRADGYRALAGYERKITGSATRALEYYAMAHRLAPEDAETLHGMGGAEFQLGRYDDALEHMRRAHSLDPRSPNTGLNLSLLLLWRRQYDEALAAADEVIAIAPTALGARQYHAMVHLALGDLQAGRAELAQLPPGVDPSRFVAYMATAWDLYWPLDPEQRALLKRLRPAAFDGDVGIWGLALAGAYEVEGDRRRAAAYGDSARVSFEQQLRSTPASDQTQLLVGQRNVLLGVALAYAGRKDEAIRAGLRGATAVPLSSDAFNGAYYQHQLARIYVLVGEPEKALDQLERLLEIPYYLSPGWLRIDPTFDPLRKNPRFMKLVQEPRQAHASR